MLPVRASVGHMPLTWARTLCRMELVRQLWARRPRCSNWLRRNVRIPRSLPADTGMAFPDCDQQSYGS